MNIEPAEPKNPWASGAAYEPYVGRWSRLVARELLAWLDVPPGPAGSPRRPRRGSRWLDAGCGTGALTETILAMAAPEEVTGVDRSEAYLSYARSRLQDPRVRFRAGDLQSLPFDDSAFDAVVSGLVLNFVPDQRRAMGELARVARPGGTVAVYVWDYGGAMQFMRYFWDAAIALDDAARELDEGPLFPICKPGPLGALFDEVGLREVEVRAIEIPTHFRDFDDYWSPFLGGQGPAPSYTMSLSEESRAALRERLRATLPVSPDGSIPLIARAWAARGLR